MRGLRLDVVLGSTALALVQITALTAADVGSARAQSAAQDLKAIEALVPLPEPADIPPPTIADIGGLPMPEPATVGTIAPPTASTPETAPAGTPPAPAAAVPQPRSAPPATANAPAAPP